MKRFTAPPSGICIHHSATPDGDHLDTTAIRRYHVQANGWDDIGYHYLVERVGGIIRIVEGRPAEFRGAHCPELNATHLGVCLVGNYDLAPPDDDLLAGLRGLCASLMRQHQMLLKGIVYHCDHASKSCPGRQFPKAGFLLSLAGEERP